MTDQGTGGDDDPRIDIVDPTNGTVVRRITPTCPSPTFGPDSGVTIDLGLDDPITALPGTDDIVVIFGTAEPCLQRWSTATGEQRWSRTPEDIGGLFEPRLVVGPSSLLLVDRAALSEITLAEGSVTAVPLPADTTLGPVVVRGRTAVVGLGSTRGTTRWEVAGLDVPTGEVLWRVPAAGGAEPLLGDGPGIDTLSATEALFTLAPRDEGSVSLVTLDGARQVTVEALATIDGESTFVGTDALSLGPFGGSGSVIVESMAPEPERLVLSADGILQVLDLTTGTLTGP